MNRTAIVSPTRRKPTAVLNHDHRLRDQERSKVSKDANVSIWQTERIRLRAIEPGDWEVFFRWNQDDEMTRALDWVWFPQSREAVRRWAEEASLRRPVNDAFHWVIEDRDEVVVGAIATHRCDRRSGTFAYGLNVVLEHRRRGYARDAIEVVLRYFFQELGYQKVTVEVYAFNEASIRLHQQLGFQQEGRLRRTIFTRGQHFDTLVFGLTAEEHAEKCRDD
jgi:RimJ/RimL family protein N-acetyltransferase